MPTNTPSSRNIFDYAIFEAILYGAIGPSVHEPMAQNPVTAEGTKGCCGGTNPACHGCDRCGSREKKSGCP